MLPARQDDDDDEDDCLKENKAFNIALLFINKKKYIL